MPSCGGLYIIPTYLGSVLIRGPNTHASSHSDSCTTRRLPTVALARPVTPCTVPLPLSSPHASISPPQSTVDGGEHHHDPLLPFLHFESHHLTLDASIFLETLVYYSVQTSTPTSTRVPPVGLQSSPRSVLLIFSISRICLSKAEHLEPTSPPTPDQVLQPASPPPPPSLPPSRPLLSPAASAKQR